MPEDILITSYYLNNGLSGYKIYYIKHIKLLHCLAYTLHSFTPYTNYELVIIITLTAQESDEQWQSTGSSHRGAEDPLRPTGLRRLFS